MKLTKDDVNRFVDKRGWSDDDEYIKLSRLREVVKSLKTRIDLNTELEGCTRSEWIQTIVDDLFGEVL